MAAKKTAAKPRREGRGRSAAKAKVRPMTKNELYTTLAEKTGLAKKDVTNVFEQLDELVRTSLTKRGGPKQFVLPGLLKIRLAEKKATPAKKGRNPQTGEDHQHRRQAEAERRQGDAAEGASRMPS